MQNHVNMRENMKICANSLKTRLFSFKIWQNDGEKTLDKEEIFRYNKSRSLKTKNIYALGGNYE